MIFNLLVILLPILSTGRYVYEYKLLPRSYSGNAVYNNPSSNVVYKRPSYVNNDVHLFLPLAPSSLKRQSNLNDLVSQTQNQASHLINILKTFADDQRAVDFVAAHYGSSSCIGNLQEAISATQTTSDLIAKLGPELNLLIDTYNVLKNERDTVVLLRGTATMLQKLDVLIPKLADLPISTKCSVSPENTLKGMKELANMTSGLASNSANEFPAYAQNTLKSSAKIIYASTDFVSSIRNLFIDFDQFCSSDHKYNVKAVDALGELFGKVDKLLEALGSDFDISATKKKNLVFAKGILGNLNKLQDLDFGFVDCNTAGSYKGTADNLLEVAQVIEEVGLENLEKQLGIKFDLRFDSQLPTSSLTSQSDSNGIVSQTQAQSSNLVNILNTFAGDQRAVDFFASNFGSSSCIRNLPEAISATETVSILITESGPELNAIVNTYNNLKNEKNTAVILRGAATILQQLDVRVPKFTDFPTSTQCDSSPENTLTGMKDLAKILSGLATSQSNEFPAYAHNTLQTSAKIVDASTDFVFSIRSLFTNFEQLCSSDSEQNDRAINALGDLFDDVDRLLKALGSDFDISAVKQKNLRFAKGLVDTIKKLNDTNIGFVECNTLGSYKGTAEILEEVAGIIDEVGLENLEKQLGIKFDFQF